jgi:hypothetical protein
MAAQIEPHFADRKMAVDPIHIAYDDARTELQLATGPVDKPFIETAVGESDRAGYERAIRILRRYASDLVRARLSSPIGLRPDPAFEDTKAIPQAVLPELARMKAEMEAAAAAGVPSTQAVPSTQSVPTPAPVAVPRPGVPGVPRPTNPGPARSR